MYDKLKVALGIELANCYSCCHLGTDDCGSDYPTSSWPCCEKNYSRTYLKSFPFKKEQKCWHPDFWKSKFKEIDFTDNQGEISVEYLAARKQFEEIVKAHTVESKNGG